MSNKLGMFIHWGIYAQTKIHEQAFARMDMEREEYEALAKTFDPTEYDPEKWVIMAKNAGMKYICFTAKHHDGFCMWNTKYTDYNIMNTPYGKDVLKMLADACQKHGMLLSIYYSNPDWHYEYGYNPNSSHQWKARRDVEPNIERLKEYIVNQVTELLTNYGRIYTFFWDIPPQIEDKSINELVRKLQPGIFINNRGFDEGDFSTPEREYEGKSNGKRFPMMTEACNSLGEQSWGFRANEDFFSMRYLMSAIDRYMSKGASYLLNVGPDEKGVITCEYADRLAKIGDWYNRMGGSLEDNEADSFEYKIYSAEFVPIRKNGKSYFHFYNGIKSSGITFMNYPNIPKSVKLMNNGELLEFRLERMPGIYTGKSDGIAEEFLHISGINVDDFASEPIALEVEW